MKKIEAFIKPERFDFVKKALEEHGIIGMTISEVNGRGDQKGITIPSRGGAISVDLLPKLKLEIVVRDEETEKVIDIILSSAKTGRIGDGRIFVLPVEQSFRVRTGEEET